MQSPEQAAGYGQQRVLGCEGAWLCQEMLHDHMHSRLRLHLHLLVFLEQFQAHLVLHFKEEMGMVSDGKLRVKGSAAGPQWRLVGRRNSLGNRSGCHVLWSPIWLCDRVQLSSVPSEHSVETAMLPHF